MSTELRKFVGTFTNGELWEVFNEGDEYEKTGIISNESFLRKFTTQFITDSALNMIFFQHEVWRELACRGTTSTRDGD